MPAGENDDAPLFEMADDAAPDERLGHRAHFDAGGHARHDVLMLERVLQSEGIHDRRQHAHVVGGGAVHALGTGRQAAEDVAAADDDGDFDAELADVGDIPRDAGGDHGIDAELLVAHQCFAGKFEKNAFVDRLDWRGLGGNGHRTGL